MGGRSARAIIIASAFVTVTHQIGTRSRSVNEIKLFSLLRASYLLEFVQNIQIKTLEVVHIVRYDESAIGNEAVATKIVLID